MQVQTMNEELKNDFDVDGTSAQAGGALGASPTVVSFPMASPIARASLLQGEKPTVANANQVLDTLAQGFGGIVKDSEPEFRRMMQANFSESGIEIQVDG